MINLSKNTLLNKETFQPKLGEDRDEFSLGTVTDSINKFIPLQESDDTRREQLKKDKTEYPAGEFSPKSNGNEFSKENTKYFVIYNNDDGTTCDCEILEKEENQNSFVYDDSVSFFYIGNEQFYQNKKINDPVIRLNARFVNYGFRIARFEEKRLRVNDGLIIINSITTTQKTILVPAQTLDYKNGDSVYLKLNITLEGESGRGSVGTSEDYEIIPNVFDPNPSTLTQFGPFIYSDANNLPLTDGGKQYGIGVGFTINSVEIIASENSNLESESLKVSPEGVGETGNFFIKLGLTSNQKITQDYYGTIYLEHGFYRKNVTVTIPGFFTPGQAPKDEVIVEAFREALSALENIEGYFHHFSLEAETQNEWDHLKLY